MPLMPRTARIVALGVAHHVTQRGNNLQDVFFTDDDRRHYLHILAEQSQTYGLTVHAYCLMTNHIHLIVTPRHADSLQLGVGRTHWRYTQTINRLHGRSGHLWQNRFFSCPVVGDHEIAAIRYVERNPVTARIVRLPWRYRWSSAAAHCGEASDKSELLDLTAFRKRYTPAQWRRILQRPMDDEIATRHEQALRTGRPLASDRWLARLETKLGKRLRPLPRGRPKKQKPRTSSRNK